MCEYALGNVSKIWVTFNSSIWSAWSADSSWKLWGRNELKEYMASEVEQCIQD